MVGYIKLHRKIKEWEWYDDANTFRLFIHCLIEANHKDKEWRGIQIKRGQFHTSIGSLSTQLKLSDKAIRLALDKLIKTKEVATKGASSGTMITICNYDNYQGFDEAEGQAEGQAAGQTKRKTNAKNTQNEPIISCFTFDEFWSKYPNKTARAESQKKYDLLTETDRELIKNTIDYFINNKPFEKYSYPMATTYINQKRWLDVIVQPKQEVTQPEIFDFSKPIEQSTSIKF